MTQKIQTLFIDDLDASAAEGTVRFGLDGAEYEIDLNARHAKELRTRWPGMCVLARIMEDYAFLCIYASKRNALNSA